MGIRQDDVGIRRVDKSPKYLVILADIETELALGNDRDLHANLLHRMKRLVENYGPSHGVIIEPRVKPDRWILKDDFPPERWISEKDIKDIIINGRTTVIFWTDGTKTKIKCTDEHFAPHLGIAVCFMKKALGNKGNFNNVWKRLLEKARVFR